jgi:hypothetical protein
MIVYAGETEARRRACEEVERLELTWLDGAYDVAAEAAIQAWRRGRKNLGQRRAARRALTALQARHCWG